jgi:hypothetical protein
LLKANHKGGRQVGYVYPESAKQKLKDRVYTNEHCANISASQKGRIQSAETRAKQSQAIIQYHQARAPMFQTPYGVFKGWDAVTDACGLTKQGVRSRMNKHPEQYYYIEETK